MTPLPPEIVVVGANHHTAPLELRERLALSPEKQQSLTERLRADGLCRELCVLNTCNRVEIYSVAGSVAATRIAEEFCRIQQLDPTEFTRAARARHNREAVVHLFEVAAGLDSQMVGEAEILGQVKDAYAAAQAAGTIGSVLNRVFQKSFHCAKVVRRETAVGEGQVSVATVAVALAEKIFGELRTSRVLLIGAGDIAEKTAKALRSREVGAITIANRTEANAAALAAGFGGSVLPFSQLGHGLQEADIVVCSTAAPTAVLTTEMVRTAMHARASRPLFLIDLALPRDIEPGAADQSNVFVYNLDDLARIAEENIAQRRAEIVRARALIATRAEAIWHKIAGTEG